MTVLDDIAEFGIKFVFQLIVGIVFFYTGEIILYIVTFGSKKPRWDYYSNESTLRWVILTEMSWWVGFLFWIFTIGWIVRELLK